MEEEECRVQTYFKRIEKVVVDLLKFWIEFDRPDLVQDMEDLA